jgi:hypothetical protein
MLNKVDPLIFNSPKSARLLAVFLFLELIFGSGVVLGLSGVLASSLQKGLSGFVTYDLLLIIFAFYMVILLPVWAFKQITLHKEIVIIEPWYSVFLRCDQRKIIPYNTIQSIEWRSEKGWGFPFLFFDSYLFTVILPN